MEKDDNARSVAGCKVVNLGSIHLSERDSIVPEAGLVWLKGCNGRHKEKGQDPCLRFRIRSHDFPSHMTILSVSNLNSRPHFEGFQTILSRIKPGPLRSTHEQAN
jgi:hypothetical protein